jgi:hypothetical protein
MNTMTRHEYRAALRKLSLPYSALFFAVVIPGVLGSAYAADRIARVSSWRREMVFLAMLPAFLAPMLLGGWLMSLADRRLGLRCHSCGESLSMGRHVRRLLRCGGACPKCGALVVDPAENAEPGAAPNGGPATRLGNSGATEGPPSVS